MEARVGGEPAADRRSLVGRVVVEDQVSLELGGQLLIDRLQELLELNRAEAGVQPADHLSRGGVERREQARGAVALVAQRHVSEPRYRGEDLVCEAWEAAAPATRQAPGVSRVPAKALVGRQRRRAARQVGHDGTRRGRLAALRRAGREVGSRGRYEGSRDRRRTRRANAPVRGRLMEILNWITRRPRTDERLRLDRATTRTSTRRRPDARHALASAANDRRHRPC